MNPYGNGSQGALNVTSGTTYLPLNTKHQFTTVNVSSGATLSTNSTSGAVLYIVATESIVINGNINVSNRVSRGNNTWAVTIDGVTYSSPGVNAGVYYTGHSSNNGGWGSGGYGVNYTSTSNGGSGGPSPSGGGGGNTVVAHNTSGYSNSAAANGGVGSSSGGGGGGTYAEWTVVSGSGTLTATAYRGGNGATSHGGNGGNGANPTGTHTASAGPGGLSYTRGYFSGGGGGGGGAAGRAGVHVVLKAPSVTINGQIITSGTNGGNGGNGGRSRIVDDWSNIWGGPGGGGGGGTGGNIEVYYGSNLSFTGALDSHVQRSGGSGGINGTGGQNNQRPAGTGASGGTGVLSYSRLKPVANFIASRLSGVRPLQVNFTNLSQGGISYSWDFGDSSTSTQTNPTHTYTSPGTYTVSLVATNPAGNDTVTRASYITVSINTFTAGGGGSLKVTGNADRKFMGSREAGGTLVFDGQARAIVLRDAESLQDKVYLYKVYDPDGNYIETWKDVVSDLTFTHEINTIGSTTMVELARNSDTLGVTTTPLQTEDGQNILTEDDQTILVATESRNQVGSGSSVDYNNRVDVVAYYGGVEPLLTEDGEVILTEDGEPILAELGAPNGRRVFTGFISEINSRYGNTESTMVQLTSYGFDLDQFPVTTAYNNNTTTVAFNSYDPSEIVRVGIDRFAQTAALEQTSYTMRTDTSIVSSGTVVSYTFRNNTYKELLDKTLELLPSNWYYRVGLGDNTVYVRERSVDPQHLFYLGKHIKALDLKGSILDVVNHTLFTGGGDPALYVERKEAPANRTRRGLEIMSDARVTLQSSAEIISEGKIEEANKLQYRTTIEVLTKQYDIESIQVGETIGFRNFGNYVDELTMTVVGLAYTPDVVQLQLETKPPTISQRLEDIRRNLNTQENQNIPSTPV